METIELIKFNKGIKKLIITPDMYLDHGGYANVYRLNKDRCAKVYNVKFPVKAKKDTKKVLKEIRNLNIDGMYSIYEFLYNRKNLEYSGYEMSNEEEGYLLKNMDEELARKILDMSPDRTINNMVKMEIVKNKLSNKGIYISDDLGSNIIIRNGTFTIYDADSYLYRPDRKPDVKKENEQVILALEASLPIRAAIKLKMSAEDIERIRKNSKELFFNKEMLLGEKISKISKEKSLGKLLMK